MKLSSAALLGALLLFTACDATDDGALDAADVEAVATVASALSVETGGALDEVAFALGGDAYADARGPGHGGHGHTGGPRGACDAESSYDEVSGAVTRTVTCERGSEDGPFQHSAARTLQAFFVDADGAPLPGPDGAASATIEVLSATSASRAPRRTREVTGTTGTATVTGLDTEEVTVDGSGSRSGSYLVTRRDGATRAADYTVTLDLTDVTGPAPRRLGGLVFHGRWRRATSGTASGTYSAVVTDTSADGEATTRTVERTFEISFPVEGEGRGRVRMGGEDHRVDLGTGAVL